MISFPYRASPGAPRSKLDTILTWYPFWSTRRITLQRQLLSEKTGKRLYLEEAVDQEEAAKSSKDIRYAGLHKAKAFQILELREHTELPWTLLIRDQ